ncbi:MAG: hypothetical protein Q4C68_00740 [Moraxella sp.]|nr:hypothetical protein [Moraxella sp.]
MPTQLIVTAENGVIEELKTVVEGFIAQYQDGDKKSITVETKMTTPVVFDDIRQLKGILNSYYPKPLSDEEIDNGIHQGMMDRTML